MSCSKGLQQIRKVKENSLNVWHLKIASGFSTLEFADGGTCWRSDTVTATTCTAKT
jgi:hypothetical protein